MNKNMFFLVKDYKTIKIVYNLMQKYDEKDYHLDYKIILSIKKHMKEYKESGDFTSGVENRKKVIANIEKIFSKYNLPADLSYIAFVESNFDPKAVNRISGCRGLWMFTEEKAKYYGLTVNNVLDERIDPAKSTEAAAKYFNDLMSIYGEKSIFMAGASCSAGENAIGYGFNLIRKIKEKNFWHLYNYNLMSDETKDYILKIIALMILFENPDIPI